MKEAMENQTLELKNTKLKALNVENLVTTVFPYTKYYKQEDSFFIKKGITGWPTWVIIIKRESVFKDHEVLFICENASLTKIGLIEDFEIFIKKSHLIGKSSFFLNPEKYGILNLNNLEIIDAYRLYKFISDQGIGLFEPTQ